MTGERPIVAETWVKFQDEFRSPTEFLMYPPGIEAYKRMAPKNRGGTVRNATVIQGHVGAVYAPVADTGFRDDVIAQTVGQEPWHDKLRKIFDENKTNADSKAGMLKILDGVTAFTKTDLWYGEDVGISFSSYYVKSKDKADDADTVTFKELQDRGKAASKKVEEDFDRARDLVKPLLQRGS